MMQTHNRNAILHLLKERTNQAMTDWEKHVNFVELTKFVIAWWEDYKTFEREDTVPVAYREQRLTVKGTELEWEKDIGFKEKPSDVNVKIYRSESGKTYPMLKGLKGIVDRCNPTNFTPYDGGRSRKTNLGLHDMSTGLMSPAKNSAHSQARIGQQQYKTLEKGGDNDERMYYIFMPLGYPEDQEVFQLLNNLAKRVKGTRKAFYELVRFYRARMTRIKLAAEHDMSTNFSLATPVGHKLIDGELVPKFRFTLLKQTDVTAQDAKYLDTEGLEQLEKGLQSKRIPQVKTSGALLAARQQAALNYRNLVLDKLRYGEVTISYRKHAGDFPKITRYVKNEENNKPGHFVVGDYRGEVFVDRQPPEIIDDPPL